jgi:hypothetical protein
MAAQCCTGEGLSYRLARRLSGAAASLLPGAVLVLLPKCPLCLAAWLTVVSGLAIPPAAAASVRGLIAAVWIAAVAFSVVQTIRRRASRRSGLRTLRLPSNTTDLAPAEHCDAIRSS